LTAHWISTAQTNALRRAFATQLLVYGVLLVGAFIVPGFVFPQTPFWIWGVLLLLSGYLIAGLLRDSDRFNPDQLVQRTVLAAIIFGFALNFDFYPHLLPYQSGPALVRQAMAAGVPTDRIVWFRRHGHSLDFYSRRILKKMEDPADIKKTAAEARMLWVYTDDHGKTELDSAGVSYSVAFQMGHFQAALLKPKFLDPASRPETLEPVYLLKIRPDQNQ
jgi:hypothetical protein